MARGVLAGWRCMPEHAGDELIGAQGEGLAGVVTVVEVGHAHGVGLQVRVQVQIEERVRGKGSALGVASQIEHDTAAVGVGRADLDVPVLAPELAHRGVPGGRR